MIESTSKGVIRMSKRTNDDKLLGTKEFVFINGKQFSPVRAKVYHVADLIKQKRESVEKLRTLQLQILKLQDKATRASEDMPFDQTEALFNEANKLALDLQEEASQFEHSWLLERFYPEAKNSGDLKDISFEEAEAAIIAIFLVNPGMGNSKSFLLMSPMMNQNG